MCAANLIGQFKRAILANPAPFKALLAAKELSPQKGAGGEYDCLCLDLAAVGKGNAGNFGVAAIHKQKRSSFTLNNREIHGGRQLALYRGAEQFAIRLDSRSLNCCTL